MVYGELGREAIQLKIFKRFVTYWCKLMFFHPNKKIIYSILNYKTQCSKVSINSPWLNHVKYILCKWGLPVVFENPHVHNEAWIIAKVELTLVSAIMN